MKRSVGEAIRKEGVSTTRRRASTGPASNAHPM